MTPEEWQNLYENFETVDLLHCVDYIDELRSHLADSDHLRPPEIRDDMMKLHTLAMAVVNNGDSTKLLDMANLAIDLEFQMDHLTEQLEKISSILSKLVSLIPDPDTFMFDDDDGEE